MEPHNSLNGPPIIAGPRSPTQRLSFLQERNLTPFVTKVKSYIMDDWDFLKKLPRNLDLNFTLLTCYIVRLQTNIPHQLGLKALVYYITKYRNLIPNRLSKEFILEVAELVLKNNSFILLGEMFSHAIDIAMSTKFAPPYANLFVGILEETILFSVELLK